MDALTKILHATVMSALQFFAGIGPHDLVYSELPTVDLLHLAQTCTTIYKSVLIHCYNINELLSPFFNSEDISNFRHMQETTGALISGSTALLFFLRTGPAPETYWKYERLCYYPSLKLYYGEKQGDRDLDLYVEHRYALEVAQFLDNVGYVFHPREAQSHSWREQLALLDLNENGEPKRVDTASYLGRGIQDVLDFYLSPASDRAQARPDITMADPDNLADYDALEAWLVPKPNAPPGKKIQLITAKRCPMDVILTYHSTCVMNVISSKAAYSLFPKATFVEHKSLNIITSGAGQDKARQKYASRGWDMLDTVGPSTGLDRRSDFKAGFRWIGDKQTWTIPLPPISSFNAKDQVVPLADFLPVHSFGLDYEKGLNERNMLKGAQLRYQLVDHVDWRNVYALADIPQCHAAWNSVKERFCYDMNDDTPKRLGERKESALCEDLVQRRVLSLYDSRITRRLAVTFD